MDPQSLQPLAICRRGSSGGGGGLAAVAFRIVRLSTRDASAFPLLYFCASSPFHWHSESSPLEQIYTAWSNYGEHVKARNKRNTSVVWLSTNTRVLDSSTRNCQWQACHDFFHVPCLLPCGWNIFGLYSISTCFSCPCLLPHYSLVDFPGDFNAKLPLQST